MMNETRTMKTMSARSYYYILRSFYNFTANWTISSLSHCNYNYCKKYSKKHFNFLQKYGKIYKFLAPPFLKVDEKNLK